MGRASVRAALKAILGGMCDQYACSRNEVSGEERWCSDLPKGTVWKRQSRDLISFGQPQSLCC